MSLSRLARAASVARAAYAGERRQKHPQRRGIEAEFLPAALEVLETPPSPLGRATAWTIAAVFAVAAAWSYFGTVDVVAIAPGKVVSAGRSKVIQPAETGVIESILVTDGQAVKVGDVLVTFDPTAPAAERDRLAADLMTARLDAARLNAALTDEPEVAFVAPTEAPASLLRVHRALLTAAVAEHGARLAGLDSETVRQRSALAGTEAEIRKLDKTMPLVRERLGMRNELAEKGLNSRLQVLELQQQLLEQEQTQIVLRHRSAESAASINSLGKQRAQAVAEFRRGTATQLADAEKRVALAEQELIKAQRRHSLQTLTAPIDGVVQQLAIHTIGGVVTPAQALMVLVPRDDKLEVEARIANLDIGFVTEGQEAEVKLETFMFTRYGTIPGRVKSISKDAVQDEKQGLYFPVRVELSRSAMSINGRPVDLAAGMAVTVEIVTEHRRVIEYLLSPVMRYRHDVMRER